AAAATTASAPDSGRAGSPVESAWSCGRTLPLPGTRDATPPSRIRTSAAAVALRASLPAKITSCMCSPRSVFALCSPRTHVIASTTLLFPQPLGPTMAVTPWSNASSDRSGKLLKPAISRRLRRILDGPRHRSGWKRFKPRGFRDTQTGQRPLLPRHPTSRTARDGPWGPGNGGQSNKAPYLGASTIYCTRYRLNAQSLVAAFGGRLVPGELGQLHGLAELPE